MNSIMILLTVSIITEGVTEWVKLTYPAIKDRTPIIYTVTAILGIGVALLTGADIFSALGIATKVPYAGQVLTGILCSRGSNYVYDLMSRISTAKDPKEQTEAHGTDEVGLG